VYKQQSEKTEVLLLAASLGAEAPHLENDACKEIGRLRNQDIRRDCETGRLVSLDLACTVLSVAIPDATEIFLDKQLPKARCRDICSRCCDMLANPV
jgi:hypothetical protein